MDKQAIGMPVRRVSGVWVPSRPEPKWREQNGLIFFSVTSTNRSGPDWFDHFEKRGVRIDDTFEAFLRSASFQPTSGRTTEVGVIRSSLLQKHNRTTAAVRGKANCHGLNKLDIEAVCLIYDHFTNPNREMKAMNLYWIMVMHAPVKVGTIPFLFSIFRTRGDHGWLHANEDTSRPWGPADGFAFGVSQKQEYPAFCF